MKAFILQKWKDGWEGVQVNPESPQLAIPPLFHRLQGYFRFCHHKGDRFDGSDD
jgi:hypothetical protein